MPNPKHPRKASSKPKPSPNPARSPLLTACATDDERTLLAALRDELAAAMDTAPLYALAPLAARLQAVATRIADLDDLAAPAESLADDLVAKRAARRAAAQREAAR